MPARSCDCDIVSSGSSGLNAATTLLTDLAFRIRQLSTTKLHKRQLILVLGSGLMRFWTEAHSFTRHVNDSTLRETQLRRLQKGQNRAEHIEHVDDHSAMRNFGIFLPHSCHLGHHCKFIGNLSKFCSHESCEPSGNRTGRGPCLFAPPGPPPRAFNSPIRVPSF